MALWALLTLWESVNFWRSSATDRHHRTMSVPRYSTATFGHYYLWIRELRSVSASRNSENAVIISGLTRRADPCSVIALLNCYIPMVWRALRSPRVACRPSPVTPQRQTCRASSGSHTGYNVAVHINTILPWAAAAWAVSMADAGWLFWMHVYFFHLVVCIIKCV